MGILTDVLRDGTPCTFEYPIQQVSNKTHYKIAKRIKKKIANIYQNFQLLFFFSQNIFSLALIWWLFAEILKFLLWVDARIWLRIYRVSQLSKHQSKNPKKLLQKKLCLKGSLHLKKKYEIFHSWVWPPPYCEIFFSWN